MNPKTIDTTPGQELPFDVSQLRWTGSGLSRPECVIATRNGTLYTADWGGVIAKIGPDGDTSKFGGCIDARRPARPNGIAVDARGTMLFVDLGDEEGGLYRVDEAGEVQLVLGEVDGRPLPPSNFVLCDKAGRTWITVSTTRQPRSTDFRKDANTGFIIVIDNKGARVVADGLGYTNECAISADGKFLFVNETYGRRMTRFSIEASNDLTNRTVIATFGAGTFPDGLALDEQGYAWITSIVSNRIIRVAPDGSQQLLFQDADPEYVDWVETAYQGGEMSKTQIDRPHSTTIKHLSSLSFGGPDLKTCYLGSLGGDRIAFFRSPVAGMPLIHH